MRYLIVNDNDIIINTNINILVRIMAHKKNLSSKEIKHVGVATYIMAYIMALRSLL